jgi:hypothetical protein
MSVSPLRKLNLDELQAMVGRRVHKMSGKPFKSRLWNATVKGVITHPLTQKPAFTFLEDETYVEVARCLAGEDLNHPDGQSIDERLIAKFISDAEA